MQVLDCDIYNNFAEKYNGNSNRIDIHCRINNLFVLLILKYITEIRYMPMNKNVMPHYKILDELLSNRYHNYPIYDLTEEVNTQLAELGGILQAFLSESLSRGIKFRLYIFTSGLNNESEIIFKSME